MRALLIIGFVGLLAQLVDGSLGMAYGVTSSTVLLAAGVAPAAASAAVHLSEVGTTLVSGAASNASQLAAKKPVETNFGMTATSYGTRVIGGPVPVDSSQTASQ